MSSLPVWGDRVPERLPYVKNKPEKKIIIKAAMKVNCCVLLSSISIEWKPFFYNSLNVGKCIHEAAHVLVSLLKL